jgi:hypothetical protein
MLKGLLALLWFFPLTMGAHAGFECLKAGAGDMAADGKLSSKLGTVILKLDSEICLAGKDEFDSVDPADEIYIVAADDGADLHALVGKSVHIKGRVLGSITLDRKLVVINVLEAMVK